MKYFALFLVVLFFSCNSINEKHPTLSPDTVLLSSQLPDESLNEQMKYTGIEQMRKFDLYFNTDNTHYFPFVAVFLLGEMSGKVGETMDTKDYGLLSLKTFNGCFFDKAYRYPDSVFFSQEKLSYDLLFDNRMNDILNNDSLYFTLDGQRWHTVGVPGKLASYSISGDFEKAYRADAPITLFKAGYYLADKTPSHSAVLTIGLMTYQCQDVIDWNDYFESPMFSTYLSEQYENMTRFSMSEPGLDYQNYHHGFRKYRN